jgi:hypothetical protein
MEVTMDVQVGKVTHYYNRISVAVLQLNREIKVGDNLLFLGHSTEFTQILDSMEINHRKVFAASAGEEVAVKVIMPVREGDEVYRVTEEAYV